VLNYIPHHEDVWRSGGIAPHVLNLNATWRWVVCFTLWLLYSSGKSPGIHWIGGWVGPRASLDTVAKKKFLTCWESNPGHPAAHSWVTLLIERDWATQASEHVYRNVNKNRLISTTNLLTWNNCIRNVTNIWSEMYFFQYRDEGSDFNGKFKTI